MLRDLTTDELREITGGDPIEQIKELIHASTHKHDSINLRTRLGVTREAR